VSEDKISLDDFFNGLRSKGIKTCKLCGQPIPPERIKEFPKTYFCTTECTLKWLAKHEGKKDV